MSRLLKLGKFSINIKKTKPNFILSLLPTKQLCVRSLQHKSIQGIVVRWYLATTTGLCVEDGFLFIFIFPLNYIKWGEEPISKEVVTNQAFGEE